MNRIKRYYSALSRYHKSNGFGIHSPFAFYFVLRVLRERLPYYAYADIEKVRQKAISQTRRHGRHPRIISIKNAKLLFRVVNFFKCQEILQFGTSYGVSTISMMATSNTACLTLYEPHLNDYKVTAKVLKPYMDRISLYSVAKRAIDDYEKKKEEHIQKRFVLVNDIAEDDLEVINSYLHSILASEGIIVMRNISRSQAMNALWDDCRAYARYGMTFSNGKFAIIVANPKLPKQDFFIWF